MPYLVKGGWLSIEPPTAYCKLPTGYAAAAIFLAFSLACSIVPTI